MIFKIKVPTFLIAVILGVFAVGCTPLEKLPVTDYVNSSESVRQKVEHLASDKTLYVFNSKGENAKEFEALLNSYSIIAGVTVKTLSTESGTDSMAVLRKEMNSETPPTIFSVRGIQELSEWEKTGQVLELNQVEQPQFKTLVENISPNLQLTLDGKASYGIPYNVEGYGYIVDTQMIADLFDESQVDAIIDDIQSSTYEQWTSFVLAIEGYIVSPSAKTVQLSKNTYTFSPTKKGLAANLTGVFSVMGAESWTYGDHFVNVALNAAFSSPFAANTANVEKIDSLKNIFTVYAKALDLKTSHLASENGKGSRAAGFISADKYGYAQAVSLFDKSKAVFLMQGNWVFGDIYKENAEMASRLEFLPVKLPITQDMITVPNLTVEKMNESIPVFVPNYYAINSKVSQEEQNLAIDFLLWLNRSPAGQKYLMDSFYFIPYNLDPDVTVLNNSLGNSILRYVKEDKMLAAPYLGAPADWSSNFLGAYVRDSYMTKQVWGEEDYSNIAQYAIDTWKSLKTKG